MRKNLVLAGLVAAAALLAIRPSMTLANTSDADVGQTFTAPECLAVWEDADLMVDASNPDDCLLGTTGEPNIPPSGH